jgi:hypothetical protein
VSLIDEALKRAQEASRREGQPAETERSRPWTPAPLPDAGLARRRALARAGLWTLAGLAAFILLAWGAQKVWNAASLPAAAPAPRVAAALPTPVPTLPAAEPTALPRAVASAAAPTLPRPTRVPIPQTEDVAPGVVEVPPPPSALEDGRTYVGIVHLPDGAKIELGGIVWSEEEPRALLNERIVAPDGYVAGFTVSKIEENRVVLVRDGMTIYLALK